jgi:Flp pilus assembly protein TadD
MLWPATAPMDSFQQTLKLAFAAHKDGRHADAEALCRTLLLINATDAQLLFLLGMVLHKTGRDAEAADWLQRAAKLQPDAARVFSGLGCALRGRGDWAGAHKNFTRAAELEPRNADHFYHLGIAEHELGELERARAAFQTAVALNPRDFTSWNNLGKIFKQFNRLDESLAAYDRALAISPGYELAKHGRALSLLTAGRLAEGFREYESRWSKITPRIFPQPRWRGEPVAGKTVFIHAEQGFGDAIHFARFIPAVRERAARVILECRPELKSLFVFSGCADEVIAFGEPIPPFDYFTSIMSLPGLLGITLENLPARVPYLTAPHAENLPAAKTGSQKVGLVWAGSRTHPDDRSRSTGLEMFAPMLQTPGITFYSLQLPVPACDRPLLHSSPTVVDLSPRLNDFLATAGFVTQLDLVIAVDTSIVHLAGALAKPVWTLTQFDADWRWLLDRSDTPWYPTMRLFRQSHRGQWPPVVTRVAEALRHFQMAQTADAFPA